MNGLGSYIVHQKPDSREIVKVYCPASPDTLICQGMRDSEKTRLRSAYGRNVPVWIESVGEEQYVSFGPFLFGTIFGVLTSLALNIIQKQTKREV
jgi:hypothetical protein